MWPSFSCRDVSWLMPRFPPPILYFGHHTSSMNCFSVSTSFGLSDPRSPRRARSMWIRSAVSAAAFVFRAGVPFTRVRPPSSSRIRFRYRHCPSWSR